MFSFEQISPGGLTFQFYNAAWSGGDSVNYYLWDFAKNYYPPAPEAILTVVATQEVM